MTLEEMEAIGNRASAIKTAKERLKEAERNVALLHTVAARKKIDTRLQWCWRPEILLESGGRYGRDITVKVEIPFGVVQQQLVYEVQRCKRAVIQLGGTP